uniref:Uncharacterized protein n=1 Tax=Schistosoma japonicum TaxID=6182 RepID=Q5C0G4_SCHJA|nr:unknown [Schistosoma japonicum]
MKQFDVSVGSNNMQCIIAKSYLQYCGCIAGCHQNHWIIANHFSDSINISTI